MLANETSVAAAWSGGYDEAGLRTWVEHLRRRLRAPQVSLGLVFMTPRLFEHAAQVLEVLQVHARIPLLVGCSSQTLIAGDQEMSEGAELALGLYHLPGATLTAVRFGQEQIEAATDGAFWHQHTGVSPAQTHGWLVFADPFHLDTEAWLRGWNQAYAPLPIVGGLASGDFSDQRTQVYLNGEVTEDGGVAVACGGSVRLASVISQGCTPIGEPWTITKVDRNYILEIANRPAYQVLLETFNGLAPEQKQRAQGNLLVGLVIDEYREEFRRGDFLVRNLLGADPQRGVLAIGALPRAGQTLQFQCRDAAAATEDMVAMLTHAREQTASGRIFGGCLCSCSGRGQHLFGTPHHDPGLVQHHLGPLGLTGFFCNGEIGPVGQRNFLHGYTASLALFVGD